MISLFKRSLFFSPACFTKHIRYYHDWEISQYSFYKRFGIPQGFVLTGLMLSQGRNGENIYPLGGGRLVALHWLAFWVTLLRGHARHRLASLSPPLVVPGLTLAPGHGWAFGRASLCGSLGRSEESQPRAGVEARGAEGPGCCAGAAPPRLPAQPPGQAAETRPARAL